jgi:hypothetical protein
MFQCNQRSVVIEKRNKPPLGIWNKKLRSSKTNKNISENSDEPIVPNTDAVDKVPKKIIW